MTFVDRRVELSLVLGAVRRALADGRGRIVFVEGAAGVGKSALVAEAVDRTLADSAEVLVARGRCLESFGSGDPYLPFIDALRDLSDESTPGFVTRDSLSGLLTELAPYWLSVVPLVGGLLSATFATATRLRGGDPKGGAAPSREALFVQYLELFRGFAAEAPVVLVLDDLHWADPGSLALLSHLARGAANLPLVTLVTVRPGSDAGGAHGDEVSTALVRLALELEREGLAERLSLGEMERPEVGQLISAELGGDLSGPLLSRIHGTAGGNPLFALELVRLLRDRDGLREVRGEWDLTPAAVEVGVPRTAEAVLERRIQGLGVDEVRILQYASVEGPEFTSSVLSRLLDMDELDLLEALERLAFRDGLVTESGELDLPDGDTATLYRFRHTVSRSVLYRQVTGKRRILLHRKAGQILEEITGEGDRGWARRLARHFYDGRVPEKAFQYARLAGEAALRMHAPWVAEELFRIALETSPDPKTRREMEEALGDAQYRLGRHDRGVEHYRTALEALDGDGNEAGTPAEARLRLRRKSLVLRREAAMEPSHRLLAELRGLLDESHDWPRERCHLLLEVFRYPGAEGVEEATREAVEIASATDDPRLGATAESQLGVVLVFQGRPEEAFPHVERALAIATELEEPLLGVQYANIAGIAEATLGRYTNAEARLQDTLERCEHLGDPRKVGAALNNLGAVRLRLGQPARAREVLLRARTIHDRRDRSALLHSLLNLAECARMEGDEAAAREWFGELARRSEEFGYWSGEAVGHAGVGLTFLDEGRQDEAESAAARARAAMADRDEWFEDRDVVELLLARLEAAADPAAASDRLGRVARELRHRDLYLWARVQGERLRLAIGASDGGGPDPETLLDEMDGALAGVQAPPLDRLLSDLRERVSRGVGSDASAPQGGAVQ